MEVLGLSHKYGFIELETSVSDYLKAVLSVRNMCTIFGASYLFSLSSLRNHCLDFADRHATDILNTDGFLHLSSVSRDNIINYTSVSYLVMFLLGF